jgi:hypothetical protein
MMHIKEDAVRLGSKAFSVLYVVFFASPRQQITSFIGASTAVLITKYPTLVL